MGTLTPEEIHRGKMGKHPPVPAPLTTRILGGNADFGLKWMFDINYFLDERISNGQRRISKCQVSNSTLYIDEDIWEELSRFCCHRGEIPT
jgi:hypothetical protein